MCWRTVRTAPARAYEAFDTRVKAERFVELTHLVGLDPARAFLQDPSALALAELTGQRTTAPRPDHTPALAPAAGPSLVQCPPVVAATLPPTSVQANLTGVTFEVLWERFLERHRYLKEGTRELHEGYGRNHFLPYFGSTDLGLILRSKPLLASNAPAGAVYVDDGWLSAMMVKERLSNQRKPIAGSILILRFIKNALVTRGQCFDLALSGRPSVLEVNPARHISLPKQDTPGCWSALCTWMPRSLAWRSSWR